ncbi:hypothetical protein L227DRAFT_468032, partial [Lentinus tigrinus ALCF2SS1-6]
LVSLTKLAKKTKEHKSALIQEVQENADKLQYCWLFEVANMHNTHLKTARKFTARTFFGRGAIMAKAPRTTPKEKHRHRLHKLASEIKGEVGLFFSDSPPQEVIDSFADFQQPNFARTGTRASRTVVIPVGPIIQ